MVVFVAVDYRDAAVVYSVRELLAGDLAHGWSAAVGIVNDSDDFVFDGDSGIAVFGYCCGHVGYYD